MPTYRIDFWYSHTHTMHRIGFQKPLSPLKRGKRPADSLTKTWCFFPPLLGVNEDFSALMEDCVYFLNTTVRGRYSIRLFYSSLRLVLFEVRDLCSPCVSQEKSEFCLSFL